MANEVARVGYGFGDRLRNESCACARDYWHGVKYTNWALWFVSFVVYKGLLEYLLQNGRENDSRVLDRFLSTKEGIT